MERIHFFTEDISLTLPAPQATATWLQAVVQQEHHQLVHLNVILCSDRYLHAKNVHYLQHDTLTDVLTFDHADTAQAIEGDIYISLERVQDNAAASHTPWHQELCTVMVHGVLHLLGYDDHTPAEQALMRQKEAFYVAQYPTWTWAQAVAPVNKKNCEKSRINAE